MGNAETIESYVAEKTFQLTRDNTSYNRAALARLRRGVGRDPGDLPEIWEITLAELPEELSSRDGKATRAELAIHTALTLFALHQQGKTESVNSKGISFGRMARSLVAHDKSNEQTVKRRFDAALTSKDFFEFSRHARSLILLSKSNPNDCGLDYPRFAKDLFLYQNPDFRISVMLKWGQDFWILAKTTQTQEEGKQNE